MEDVFLSISHCLPSAFVWCAQCLWPQDALTHVTTLASMMIRRCTTRRTHLAHLRLSYEILRRQFVKWRQRVLYQVVSRIYEFDEP